jgi:hypothetical protein
VVLECSIPGPRFCKSESWRVRRARPIERRTLAQSQVRRPGCGRLAGRPCWRTVMDLALGWGVEHKGRWLGRGSAEPWCMPVVVQQREEWQAMSERDGKLDVNADASYGLQERTAPAGRPFPRPPARSFPASSFLPWTTAGCPLAPVVPALRNALFPLPPALGRAHLPVGAPAASGLAQRRQTSLASHPTTRCRRRRVHVCPPEYRSSQFDGRCRFGHDYASCVWCCDFCQLQWVARPGQHHYHHHVPWYAIIASAARFLA